MLYLEEQLSQAGTSKQWMMSRIEAIKTAPDGAKGWLKDLGKNDLEHAKAVEEYVGKVLLESNTRLCPEEIYLLLFAIYTHDIGYREGAQAHALTSYKKIIEHPEAFFIHDKNLAIAVALIGRAHGMDDLAKIPTNYPVDFLSKTREFDLRFLGALLLLADEMDQGYLRVFNRAGHDNSIRSSVYHIEIGPQIVKLKTKPQSREQWEELRNTADHIQKRLQSVSNTLRSRGVKLEQVTLYPTVWAGKGDKHDYEEPIETTKRIQPGVSDILFLLDRTVLGAQVLQQAQLQSRSVTDIPISAVHVSGYPLTFLKQYSGIIWMLGEDFEKPLPREILDFVLGNTSNGGGLVLFPFVAWSVSQGINERIQDVLPVSFKGDWREAHNQWISDFRSHPITVKAQPFAITNTFESLTVKQEAKCIIADSEHKPFLTVGKFGKGRVAYINASSHSCATPHTMASPWQQNSAVQEIIAKTITWILGD